MRDADAGEREKKRFDGSTNERLVKERKNPTKKKRSGSKSEGDAEVGANGFILKKARGPKVDNTKNKVNGTVRP